jgi:hypothetical protein
VPDLHCGICTGGVRLFHDTRYGRPITDWKHTDAPAGTQPHRPVLGRPVDAETLARLHGKPEQPTPQPASKTYAPPSVAPRPAKGSEVPPSAQRLQDLGVAYGWEARAAFYETAEGKEVCVVKLRRRDLGVVGVWEARGFSDGFTRCGSLTDRVGSEQLKAFLRQRDERCPDCGRSSVAHHEGDCP